MMIRYSFIHLKLKPKTVNAAGLINLENNYFRETCYIRIFVIKSIDFLM